MVNQIHQLRAKHVETPRLYVHEGRGADGGDADLTRICARVRYEGGVTRGSTESIGANVPRSPGSTLSPRLRASGHPESALRGPGRTHANNLPPTLAPGNLSLGSAQGYSGFIWRGVYHKHGMISNSQRGADRRRVCCFPAPCGGFDPVATRVPVRASYTYTWQLVRQLQV